MEIIYLTAALLIGTDNGNYPSLKLHLTVFKNS